MPRAKKRSQMGLSEQLLEDANLEQLLHEREVAREGLAEAKEEFAGADRQARGVIEARGLGTGSYRCGAFVVTISHDDPRDVSFTRKGGTRTRIKALSGEA